MNSQELIKSLKAKNISQNDIADLLEIRQGNVSNISTGKRNFSHNQLMKLVKSGVINKREAIKVWWNDYAEKNGNNRMVAGLMMFPISNFIANNFNELSTIVYYVKYCLYGLNRDNRVSA